MPHHRVACFDIGGVIVRICRSWDEACAAAGVGCRRHDLNEAIALARLELVKRYETGVMETSDYFRRMSDLHDRAYSPREIAAVHHAWLIEQYEGLGDIIGALNAAGIITAALSNTNHAHWIRMGEFPAVMSLRHHFVSHRLGVRKPDPAIFRALQRHMGASADEILYFDDTAENVLAAEKWGWDSVLIDPTSRPADQIAAALRARDHMVGI